MMDFPHSLLKVTIDVPGLPGSIKVYVTSLLSAQVIVPYDVPWTVVMLSRSPLRFQVMAMFVGGVPGITIVPVPFDSKVTVLGHWVTLEQEVTFQVPTAEYEEAGGVAMRSCVQD
jgi:hypothetical protein